MGKHVEDFKNKSGMWVQRHWVGEKYTWTTSGILWNNIKERCTIGGATQLRETTYIGCTNEFKDFQDFTNWHREQTGYGLGYQLDADILKGETKKYSKDTCVLIPPALNKFLQSYKGKRGEWPQGVYEDKHGKLVVEITNRGVDIYLGSFYKHEVSAAVSKYSAAKTKAGQDWYSSLLSGDYIVNPLVIEYMKNWKYTCDWKPND